MAAVADPERSTDLEKFGKDLEKALPPYARPVFLRFLNEVNKTGGFSLELCPNDLSFLPKCAFVHFEMKLLV